MPGGCCQFCHCSWQAGQVTSRGLTFLICAVRGEGKDCVWQSDSHRDICIAIPGLCGYRIPHSNRHVRQEVGERICIIWPLAGGWPVLSTQAVFVTVSCPVRP